MYVSEWVSEWVCEFLIHRVAHATKNNIFSNMVNQNNLNSTSKKNWRRSRTYKNKIHIWQGKDVVWGSEAGVRIQNVSTFFVIVMFSTAPLWGLAFLLGMEHAMY